MPVLQIFFISKLFAAIEKRKKYFKEILDEHSKSGMYQCFMRAGLDTKNLFSKNISYRMVEKVVMDIRAYYPVQKPFT